MFNFVTLFSVIGFGMFVKLVALVKTCFDKAYLNSK